MFDLRTHILNQPLKTQDIPTPFWSQKDENGVELVDGHIAMQDVPGDQLQALQGLLKQEPIKLLAALICASFINKETGARIFQDTDRDMVAGFGSSVLMPIMDPLQAFLGLNTEAVEQAKKNLLTSLVSGGGTLLPNASSIAR